MSREEFNNLNEEHILSLRKKRGNKNIEHLKKMNLNAQLLTHDIDIKKLILLIQNDNLYIQCIYTTFEKEESKYNYVVSLFNYKTLKEVCNLINVSRETTCTTAIPALL